MIFWKDFHFSSLSSAHSQTCRPITEVLIKISGLIKNQQPGPPYGVVEHSHHISQLAELLGLLGYALLIRRGLEALARPLN